MQDGSVGEGGGNFHPPPIPLGSNEEISDDETMYQWHVLYQQVTVTVRRPFNSEHFSTQSQVIRLYYDSFPTLMFNNWCSGMWFLAIWVVLIIS